MSAHRATGLPKSSLFMVALGLGLALMTAAPAGGVVVCTDAGGGGALIPSAYGSACLECADGRGFLATAATCVCYEPFDDPATNCSASTLLRPGDPRAAGYAAWTAISPPPIRSDAYVFADCF